MTDNPVGYTLTCRTGPPWKGQNCIVINQGEDPVIGYSIWSAVDAERLIGEMRIAMVHAFGENAGSKAKSRRSTQRK